MEHKRSGRNSNEDYHRAFLNGFLKIIKDIILDDNSNKNISQRYTICIGMGNDPKQNTKIYNTSLSFIKDFTCSLIFVQELIGQDNKTAENVRIHPQGQKPYQSEEIITIPDNIINKFVLFESTLPNVPLNGQEQLLHDFQNLYEILDFFNINIITKLNQGRKILKVLTKHAEKVLILLVFMNDLIEYFRILNNIEGINNTIEIESNPLLINKHKDNDSMNYMEDTNNIISGIRGALSSSSFLKFLKHILRYIEQLSKINKIMEKDIKNIGNINKKNMDNFIKGYEEGTPQLSKISFNRIALMETAYNQQFFYAPVGIDEALTTEDKIRFIKNAYYLIKLIKRYHNKKNDSHSNQSLEDIKISILSGGRSSDKGRSDYVDKTIIQAEQIKKYFNEKDVYIPAIDITRTHHSNESKDISTDGNGRAVEQIPSNSIYVDNILIENAIKRDADFILAPEGISGNLIYRTLVHLGAGNAFGAIYSRIFLEYSKVLIDCSRVAHETEILGSLYLALGFSHLSKFG
ncbi:MAG: hypothetical protein ACTSU2_11020 [Promethearchaeota archaeon]